MEASSYVFVKTAFEKILSFRDAKKVKLLNDTATSVLARIEKLSKSPSADVTITPSELVLTLKLACDTRNWKVAVLALDCMQKLITFGFLKGGGQIEGWPEEVALDSHASDAADANWAESKGNASDKRLLIDQVVASICSCFVGPETNETVEVQVIKALLAAVTSPTGGLHGQALLSSIRTTYNIYLLSQSAGNQQTAKATLTQMITTIFLRFEGHNLGQRPDEIAFKASVDPDRMSLRSEVTPHQEAPSTTVSLADSTRTEDWEQNDGTSPFDSTIDTTMDVTISAAPVIIQDGEIVSDLSQSTDQLALGEGGNESEATSVNTGEQEAAANGQDISVAVDPENADVDPFYKDAYLVFRALCRLSMKPVSEIALLDPRSHAMRSKILSLQLLLNILEHSGPLFRSGEMFISGIKKYLIVSLYGNASLNNQTTFTLMSQIFLHLLIIFPAHLKYEIEVCFKEIFFKLLASKTSSVDQKTMVLELLKKICEKPQKLLDIFINYDCDPEALDSNIFEKIVTDLCKLVQNKVEADPQTGVLVDDAKLKAKGLECLSEILASMVNWCKEKDDSSDNVKEETETEGAAPARPVSQYEILPVKDSAQQFEQIKHHKQALLQGIEMFNWEVKKGMKFLLSNKVIGENPADIAAFFLHTEGLNKKHIGEYLGGSDEFKVKTMHAFVDMIDFTGLEFLPALRKFLQCFLLPGEAQQIDRLMLKFAERYVVNNPNAFANADTAYVLAYSVIMLNVDQHNKKVKRKMTLEDFLKNNRGINDGKDLPEALLKSIYEDINQNELKMKEEDHQQFFHGGAKPKTESYAMDSKDILKATQNLFKDRKRRNKAQVFYSANQIEHVKPMFEVSWMPVLVAVSGFLQENEEPRTVELCLGIIRNAIRIAAIFYLDLPRNTYISTLAKLTEDKTGAIKPKNFAAIRTMVEIGLADGNYLKTSWNDVLQCISRLQALSERENDSKFKRKSSVEEVNAQSMVVAVDRIFASSTKLNGNAIVDFAQALCAVSWEEIESSAALEEPRMYLMQKIVEISYYNMARIRLEWSKIWQFLGEHFNKVGCHRNQRASTFAVDSLRQLSMKFLEKGELAHFQFQKDFLAPFSHIYTNNPTPNSKDLILRCISQMIQAAAQNIKSGWKTMLVVLGKAARESNANLVSISFETVKSVINSHFNATVTHGSFNELIRCLVEFARNQSFPKISLQSIEIMRKSVAMTAELSSSQKELVITLSDQPDTLSVKDTDHDLKFWFPSLFGFYEVIMSCDLEVRTRAVKYLNETLKTYGKNYSTSFWDVVFKGLLFPIFDDLKQSSTTTTRKLSSNIDTTEWMSTTCVFALRSVLELFNVYFEKLSFLLDAMLELFGTFIQQEDDSLSRIGCSCLSELITSNSKKLTEAMWEKISTFVKSLFLISAPQFSDFETLEASSKGEGEETASNNLVRDVVTKNVFQLLLIQTLNDLFNAESKVYDVVQARHLLKFVDILSQGCLSARNFNDRFRKYVAGKNDFAQYLPFLLQREPESCSCQLKILFRMFGDFTNADREDARSNVELRMLSLSKSVLETYTALATANSPDISIWNDTVALLLNSLAEIRVDQFLRHLPVFYTSLVALLSFDLPQNVREALKYVLIRTGSVFSLTSDSFKSAKGGF